MPTGPAIPSSTSARAWPADIHSIDKTTAYARFSCSSLSRRQVLGTPRTCIYRYELRGCPPPGVAALWFKGLAGKKNADRHDRPFHGLTDRGRPVEDAYARPHRADRTPRSYDTLKNRNNRRRLAYPVVKANAVPFRLPAEFRPVSGRGGRRRPTTRRQRSSDAGKPAQPSRSRLTTGGQAHYTAELRTRQAETIRGVGRVGRSRTGIGAPPFRR